MGVSGGFSRLLRATCCFLYLQVSLTAAVSLNVNSYSSIRTATKSIVEDIFSIYIGNEPGQTPGMLPGSGQAGGYYWWVGGGMFGTLINYWHHTGDDTWVEDTRQAIAFQSAPSEGGYFEPHNESQQLGNDDISFWAFSALMAAEYNFPDPPSYAPSWLSMVQGVFNRQASRWDNVCGGGLRWQVYNYQGTGYYYKNSISNGAFFQIGARLGKYTGNQTYIDWAEKTYDWMEKIALIDGDYNVYDGVDTSTCKIGLHVDQWSYNVGVFLYGCAVMWNVTQQDIWKERTLGLIKSANTFMNTTTGNPVLTEVICEPYDSCQIDQSTFKAYLARWARAATEVAPDWAQEPVDALLQYSAPAAAVACSGPGGNGGVACGQEWYLDEFDGRTGIGMQINALEVMQTLIPASGPLSLKTGAKSASHPSAGGGGDEPAGGDGAYLYTMSISTGDKAGAAILTILLAVSTITGAWWIVK